MLERRELFPHVLEMNYQARRRLGCCVYLIDDQGEWLLIDIGYEDTVREIVDLIRQLDFPLSQCKYLVVTHADADHIQGLKLAQDLLPQAQAVGHPLAKTALAEPDRILTYAEIPAQGISINLPRIRLDRTIDAHIVNLRRKIEPDPAAPTYIQTVFGVGYRFEGRRSAP